jgi:uncharacterized protein YjbI with pentapeptide repeats
LSAAIQSNKAYVDERFEGASLVGVELVDAEFHACTFARAVLREATLRRCRFSHCTFRACDLSLARVPDSQFALARFEDCKLVGVNWAAADWSAVRLGPPLRFVRCALSHATFLGLDLRGLVIRECTVTNVDFREADLSGADFSGTDLTESLFQRTDLSGADLRAARNYHIVPGQNVLRGARFSLPEALALLYSMEIVLEGDEP